MTGAPVDGFFQTIENTTFSIVLLISILIIFDARSTNKFCLEVYSKIKNSLSAKDKKLFSKRVKKWFQIETTKLEKKDPLPISRLIK